MNLFRFASPLFLCCALLLLALTGCGSGSGSDTAAAAPAQLLVFSKTGGFRHASIEAGQAAIEKLAAEHGYGVTLTEDADRFRTDTLSKYRAVVFLSTTGDVLNPAQQEAFERYIQAGGGYMGIHAAADTEYDWPCTASSPVPGS